MHLDISVEPTQESELLSLISQLVSLKPEPELTSLIKQIIFRFKSMNWEPMHFISFSYQAEVELEQGKFRVSTQIVQLAKKGECHSGLILFRRSTTENRFCCLCCGGKNHEEYEKFPVEVKHPLHPKHSLQLVFWDDYSKTRKCYCCDEYIEDIFYYCLVCDYNMTLDCVNKPPPLLSIDHPKWHEHALALFPSQASLPCNLCAIPHPSCPFYLCPPCDFVVHQKCLSLPRVIRISRHPQHRISFTHSFDQGDRLICGICRKKIDNDYGGYSCFKDGCSYKAHSKCATQSNVWDGEDLEGVPEEIIEVLEPFVRVSEGIIQHFSHQQHHLLLDENTTRDYNDKTMCQACIMPIYSGNFYSCIECEFIMHETCANLSRVIYHPIHPHPLTLVGGEAVLEVYYASCLACLLKGCGGFFYKCGKEGCARFKLHVQCATISEPLAHGSHTHPLFLTSKPGEKARRCSVCKCSMESFNCVEGECDFALFFRCATMPHEVKYKHDKHMLNLFYGGEPSTMTHWCEVCEKKVDLERWYYKCDEYCCVTLHIRCLIGEDLYMKPGSSFLFDDTTGCVLPNNHHMSRPFCCRCKKRCPYKIVFRTSGLIYCSMDCLDRPGELSK